MEKGNSTVMTARQWCELFGVKWDETGKLYFVECNTKDIGIKMAEAGFNNGVFG